MGINHGHENTFLDGQGISFFKQKSAMSDGNPTRIYTHLISK